MSMYAAASPIDLPDPPAAVASLMNGINELMVIEFSVDAELSLIESTGVPEWGGVPISRGLFLNMTGNAAFLGFAFDFALLARLRLPNPTPAMAAAFSQGLMSFFTNPMGVVTGEVDLSAIGLDAGIQISANGELPFFPMRLDFFGLISFSRFELRASAFFHAGPFGLDVTVEVRIFAALLSLGPPSLTTHLVRRASGLCACRSWAVQLGGRWTSLVPWSSVHLATSQCMVSSATILIFMLSTAPSAGQCLASTWRGRWASTAAPADSRFSCALGWAFSE
jgi:hypothetical protein